ncbi:MAG: glycosyltransferase family 4 protein [Desulfobacteraceae bacterium]|nr:glycosyltransferase family 4 protein [Desulfobacteraceae bacterium]MBC2752116.1 glycosyltransferase family 4 protein [Desulfobacteraceae bacterium]
MGICSHCGKVHNVGIVATRLAGTDGVSLEAEKWAQVFETAGFNCFYFAGELDTPEAHSYLIPEAHFRHPDILDIYQHCFGVQKRSIQVTEKIHRTTQWLKEQLYRFIEKFDIQLLVPENALAIPLNLPLGIALTELISETAIPTIAHHHDFFWERQHFLTNAVWEYLNMAFPPHLPSIRHVVINSSADNQLGLRTGISATVVPNVMDFDHPPAPPDAYTLDVRENLGIEEDSLLVLQPTRVVKRKGIEHAVELVRRLGRKATLVISHASGDEGHDYEQRVREYSRMMGVETRFVSQIINEKRGQTEDGRKIYTLEDIYPYADLVTYPSDFEGFGNAFLEAVYFRKPIVVNIYSIYQVDIQPKGFEVIQLDGYVTEEAVQKTLQVLDDPALRQQMVDRNFEIARRCYSYQVLKRRLGGLIQDSIACWV